MQNYIETNPLSTLNSGGIEAAISDSIFAVRERELTLFGENRDSAGALRLASIRTELQRLRRGQPVRPEVLARAVQPSPADFPEGAESDLARDPAVAEVVGA